MMEKWTPKAVFGIIVISLLTYMCFITLFALFFNLFISVLE